MTNSQGGSQGAVDLNALFGNSGVSSSTMDVLTGVDIGADINAALGVTIDSLKGNEMFFLNILLDDSTSMDKNTDVLIDGVNAVIQAVIDSSSVGDVLVHITSLNRGLIVAPMPIRSCPKLSRSLYMASGQTPLFDGSCRLLGVAMAKIEEALQAGMPARCHSVIVSDGAPYGVQAKSAGDVKTMVEDMDRTQPEAHIVFGMGISDGHTDFTAMFNKMGVGLTNPKHILTPGNTPSEIREAFAVVSRSAATASQGASGFSQALSGQASP
jgi:hypothetical protein